MRLFKEMVNIHIRAYAEADYQSIHVEIAGSSAAHVANVCVGCDVVTRINPPVKPRMDEQRSTDGDHGPAIVLGTVPRTELNGTCTRKLY